MRDWIKAIVLFGNCRIETGEEDAPTCEDKKDEMESTS